MVFKLEIRLRIASAIWVVPIFKPLLIVTTHHCIHHG